MWVVLPCCNIFKVLAYFNHKKKESHDVNLIYIYFEENSNLWVLEY